MVVIRHIRWGAKKNAVTVLSGEKKRRVVMRRIRFGQFNPSADLLQ